MLILLNHCFYDGAFMELGTIVRTEHYLFHVLGIASKSRAKVCAQWMNLKAPPPPQKKCVFPVTSPKKKNRVGRSLLIFFLPLILPRNTTDALFARSI